MWKNWSIINEEKLSEYPIIYIGCMTGTSADSTADFTAAVFDENGLPICFRNCPVSIPSELRNLLLEVSKKDRSELLRQTGSDAQAKLTNFLVDAFQEVITKLNLEDYPKEKIILSPHGQTIDHNPNHKNFYTDIIVNGPILAQKSGYKVVTNHRQAPLAVSMAAPLAPVLIKKLFFSSEQNVVLLNGGGIANIAVLFKDNPSKIVGYDTGPANGPIDSLIQTISKHHLSEVPDHLSDDIITYQYDRGGNLASIGKIIPELEMRLSQHHYFTEEVSKKSADRAEFGLDQWVLPCMEDIKLVEFSWLDIVTTVSSVVADTVANAIIASLDNMLESTTKLIHYGGMSHNLYLMARIESKLAQYGHFEFTEMESLNYDPDYFESLLMAYLGFCANNKIAINLAYCSRPNILDPYAIPGTVSYPTTECTRRDDVSIQVLINMKSKSEVATDTEIKPPLDDKNHLNTMSKK